MQRYEEFLKNFAGGYAESKYLDTESLPEVPLYADQVASYLADLRGLYAASDIKKSTIEGFAKKGVIPSPEDKLYDKELVLFAEMALSLVSVYGEKAVESLMKPFIDNAKSALDDDFDFIDTIAKVAPAIRAERRDAADAAASFPDSLKRKIREEGLSEDDDLLELFLVLVGIAARAEAEQAIGRSLLEEYFLGKDKKEKK